MFVVGTVRGAANKSFLNIRTIRTPRIPQGVRVHTMNLRNKYLPTHRGSMPDGTNSPDRFTISVII